MVLQQCRARNDWLSPTSSQLPSTHCNVQNPWKYHFCILDYMSNVLAKRTPWSKWNYSLVYALWAYWYRLQVHYSIYIIENLIFNFGHKAFLFINLMAFIKHKCYTIPMLESSILIIESYCCRIRGGIKLFLRNFGSSLQDFNIVAARGVHCILCLRTTCVHDPS
jgi:hypothetical protein